MRRSVRFSGRSRSRSGCMTWFALCSRRATYRGCRWRLKMPVLCVSGARGHQPLVAGAHRRCACGCSAFDQKAGSAQPPVATDFSAHAVPAVALRTAASLGGGRGWGIVSVLLGLLTAMLVRQRTIAWSRQSLGQRPPPKRGRFRALFNQAAVGVAQVDSTQGSSSASTSGTATSLDTRPKSLRAAACAKSAT